jgi:hypothetical protein
MKFTAREIWLRQQREAKLKADKIPSPLNKYSAPNQNEGEQNDMDRLDKDSLEYVLWCAKIHVVDLLAQLRDDGAIPVVELGDRLTKLLGLLQETEAKAQGKPLGNTGIPDKAP